MAEYEVDVVLSDQRMPGMTGVEFLRRAKELYPDTVRMVLSGYTELQSITDAVNEGAIYRFLTKPWDDERLLVHVREAFAHKELGDENKRLATEVVTASEALAAANERLEMVLNNQQQQIDQEAARANAVRDMLDLVPVPLLGVDPDGVIVLANQEAQRVLGHRIAVLGEPAQTVLQQPLPPMATELLSTPAQTPQTPASRPCTGWAPLERQGARAEHHAAAWPDGGVDAPPPPSTATARQRNALLRRERREREHGTDQNTSPCPWHPFRPHCPRCHARCGTQRHQRLKPHHQHPGAQTLPAAEAGPCCTTAALPVSAAWMPKARPMC